MKKRLFVVFLWMSLTVAVFSACTGTAIKRLDSIEVVDKPTKIVYEVGQVFDPDGMTVSANYSDGTSEEITDYTYSTDALTEDDTSIVISYTFNGVTKTTSVSITVYPIVDAVAPSITAQPISAVYDHNATASALTVTASVPDGGTLSYKWYKNSANSTIGGTEVGTNSNSYTPSTESVGTLYYYVEITNTNNSVNGIKTASVTSEIVSIAVESLENEIVEATGFTMDGLTGRAVVANATTSFSLENIITVSENATWKLFSDIEATEEIGLSIPLTEGDNTVYVVVTAQNGTDTALYTMTVRRRPMYLVTFNTDGGTSVDSQSIEEDSLALSPPSDATTKTGYTFSEWDFDFDTPIVEQTIIDAIWTANTLTVSYSPNKPAEASGTISQTTVYSTHIYDIESNLADNTFELIGWSFTGWNTEANGSGDAYSNLAEITNSHKENGGALSLFAQWTANTVTVTFNINKGAGSSTPTTPTAYTNPNFDSAFGTLPETSREGYTFNGWFTSTSGSKQATEETLADTSYVPNGSTVTLYARWTVDTITVTFDTNKGTGSSTPTEPTAYTNPKFDASFGTLPSTSREGYTFNGWFTEASGGTKLLTTTKADISKVPNGSTVTLYAQWTAKTVTVTFDRNKGAGSSTPTTPTSYTSPKFDSAFGTLPTTSRTGYEFIGWFTEASDGTQITADTLADISKVANGSSVTIYAQWTAKTITVTFNTNKGSGSSTPTEPTAYTNPNFDSAFGTLPETSREGYTFNGWSTSGSVKVTEETVADLSKVADGSTVTLYAQWTVDTITVTFDTNKGTGSSTPTEPTAYTNPKFDANFGTLPSTSREGYTFNGWFTEASGGTKLLTTTRADISKVANGSTVTLYAQWTAKTLTFSYKANKPSGASSSISQTMENSVHTYDIASNLTDNAFTLTGWTFTGWNEYSTGFSQAYDNLEEITNSMKASGGTITLYAQWVRNTVNVIFDTNDATGSTRASTPSGYNNPSFDLEFGTLPSITREGYTFNGWYFVTSGGTKLLSSTKANVTNVPNGTSVILYAQWIAKTVAVSFSTNKGTGSSYPESPTSYTSPKFDSAFGTLPTTSRKGYDFIGWFTEASEGTQITDEMLADINNVPNASTIKLYAQWKVLTPLVTYDYDGATGGIDGENITLTYDQPFTLPVPSKSPFTFGGWYTKFGGDGNKMTDESGASLYNWNIASDTTLYAYWVGTSNIFYQVSGDTAYVNSSNSTATDVVIQEYYIGRKVTSIGDSAFTYKNTIETVTIPAGITSIGNRAFERRSNLVSVIFLGESQLTSIGNSAFNNCTSLTTINLPDSVTSIGSGAFTESGLTSFTTPLGVTSLPDSLFYSALSLTSITIPSRITSIGEYVFAYSGLASIEFEEGSQLTSIGSHAFRTCGSLTTIKIPASVTSIGSHVFYYSLNLVSVEIEEGSKFTSIGDYAFYSCRNLLSVELPSTLTSIGKYAFDGCTKLESITLPASLESIDSAAFYGCINLTRITIPSNVATIAEKAFEKCDTLTIYAEIHEKPDGWHTDWNYSELPVIWDCIYNDETEDGYIYYEFEGITYALKDGEAMVAKHPTSFTTANIADWVLYNGESYLVTSIGDSAFNNCASLTSVTIPSSVTSIGSRAFFGCNGLTSVIIPSLVTSIGDYAFFDCSNLTTIIVPISVTTLGDSVFSRCESLTIYAEATSKPAGWYNGWNTNGSPVVWNYLNNDVANDGYIYHYYDGLLYALKDGVAIVKEQLKHLTTVSIASSVTFKDVTYSVTSIGDNAFSNCINLVSVIIPDGVTSIGQTAFGGCVNLESVTIPSSVTSMGRYSFERCSKLASIVLPASLTSLGENSFYDCISLTSVEIPNGVTIIKKSTFEGCTNLASVVLPNGITSIEGLAFYNCSSLATISIPTTVASIGERAFFGCSSLTSIIIPEGVTTIYNTMFKGCSSLVSVTFPSTITEIKSGVFENCISLVSITIPSSVTKIDNSTFYGCINLTSIVIPEGVTSIGTFVFNGCTNLTDVTIPSSVTSIGESAFRNCPSLVNITLPVGLTSISANTFRDCNNLVSVTIPEGVLSIGNDAFNGCVSLASLTIPESVTSIGARTFYNCNSVTELIILSKELTVGTEAFRDCRSLRNVALSSELIALGNTVFNGLADMQSITISSSMASIGNAIFNACSRLTIYAEADSQPEGWNSNWNPSARPVVWGCTIGADADGLAYVVSFTKTADSISNATYNTINAPFRNGYTFGGWALSEEDAINGVSAYTASNVNSAADGTTLYAIWIEIVE